MKGNLNHPKKGSQTRVEPIRRIEDVEAIIELLKDKPREKLLFIMGINNGLRVGDLLKLTVSRVRFLKSGDSIIIKESKTKKLNHLWINEATMEALKHFRETYHPTPDTPLFVTKKTHKPLSIQTVNQWVKEWGRAVGIKENLGCHSLRKTFAYHQRVFFKTPIEILSLHFNHASPKTTMVYLGIEAEEVDAIMKNSIGRRVQNG
jgi:integrase